MSTHINQYDNNTINHINQHDSNMINYINQHDSNMINQYDWLSGMINAARNNVYRQSQAQKFND